MPRRAFIRACLCGLSLLGLRSLARAEAPTAPIPVQARILVRVLPFDRGFAARAGSVVPIVLAEVEGDADSLSATKQMDRALADIGKISDKPLRIETVRFVDAPAFVAECQRRGALAAYFSPGLGAHMGALSRAFARTPVLTLAAVEAYVPQGAVLGVEITSGKPRVSVNLLQARNQGIDFPSALLKLARVYQ